MIVFTILMLGSVGLSIAAILVLAAYGFDLAAALLFMATLLWLLAVLAATL